MTFPTEFPGAWQNVPPEIRAFLAEKLVEKALEIHEGAAGLIKFLYAGTKRPGAPRPLSYVAKGHEFWPHVVEDAKVLSLLKQPIQETSR